MKDVSVKLTGETYQTIKEKKGMISVSKFIGIVMEQITIEYDKTGKIKVKGKGE